MNYLVCINTEGVQCKFALGDNPGKSAKRIKSEVNRASIKFLFEKGEDPRKSREFESEKRDLMIKITQEEGAWLGHKSYEIRKTTIGNYVEIMVEMSEKEFSRLESKGIEGAIELLYSVKRLMRPQVETKEEGSKVILKWVEKLEAEKD